MKTKTTKPFSFFFHYNKPASRNADEPILSLHFKKTCHLVKNIVCSVSTTGKIRKIQPRFVMTGKAMDISIQEGVAFIS